MAVEEKPGSPVAIAALKKMYDARKKNEAVKTESKKSDTSYKKSPMSIKKVASVSGGNKFKVSGYPEGVPPGANKTRWDYDDVTKTYLSGDGKEKKRRSLWDQYRSIHKKQGRRASSFVKEVMAKPSVRSMKYGNSG